MQTPEINGVTALASILMDVGLLGSKAISYGSPDTIIMKSGGPVTHLAKNSILCGPSKKRVVIKQPEFDFEGKPFSPMTGEIKINYQKLPFVAEIEEWKHGCWYHSNSISTFNLKDLFEKLKCMTPNVEIIEEVDEHIPKGPFWAGAISYDMVQWTQPINIQHKPESGTVLTILWMIENYVIHKNNSDVYSIHGLDSKWVSGVERIIDTEDISFQLPEQKLNNAKEYCSIKDYQHVELIERVKSAISDGIFYQINIGRFWSGELVERPFTIFQRLELANPAPFSIYIESPDLGLAIVSSSPETLLRCEKNKLSTAPIKGTIIRGSTKIEDDAMIASMVSDIKERSEHRMLVDLMRNDLSTVCDVGSVNVSRFDVESYANVHHLVSHIEGHLSNEMSSYDALNSMFPGGSITGCPRTMVCAVIDEVEPRNRSFWTGSAGWIEPHGGNCSWNILIRTLEAKYRKGIWQGVVGAGGGITIRSEAENEVKETIWKSQAIRKACGWLEPTFDITNKGSLGKTELDIENLFNYEHSNPIHLIKNWGTEKSSLKNRVLIIDNLDSFTLNIAHAIAGNGFDVTILNGRDKSADELADSAELIDILVGNTPSHIILGPGPGKPNDSKLTMQISKIVLSGVVKTPVLGVCLGHQALGVCDGFQLKRDSRGAVHGTPVSCTNDGTGLFLRCSKSSAFVRYNSLLIEKGNLGEMIPNIFDENGAIMGLRHKSLPIHSVQFHPESIGSQNGLNIFSAFLSLQSDA